METTVSERVVLRLMREAGLTNAAVANAMGIQRQLLFQFTHRTLHPERPMLERLAVILRVDRAVLVDEDGRWRVAQ